jgi:hypothetical protein
MNRRGLIFYWATDNSPKTVFEHVSEISQIEGYSLNTININNSFFYKVLTSPIGFLFLNRFYLIIVHNTITYDADYSRAFLKKIKPSKNSKLVYMKQDEMLLVNKTKEVVKEFNVDLLVTLIAEDEIEKVYPRAEFPNLLFFHSLTGYLSKDLISQYPSVDLDDRVIDVFYRGMVTPYEWGKGSFEKHYIGNKFLEKIATFNLGLKCDISSRLEDRVYGSKWIEKLSNSRAVLGVESGASIFDFDGSIASNMRELLLNRPDLSFEEASRVLLGDYEGNVHYRTISPRHLEACMAGAVPVMFEGHYNGFFKANVNYIKLDMDFGNFLEVCDHLNDIDYLQQIVENNKRDILENHYLTYDYFKENLKQSLDSLFE